MKKIQDKIKAYQRKKAIQKITKGLGKITEDESTIYCHVDERKFKRKCDYQNIYGFYLTKSSIYIYGKMYSLRKNIVYIFDGIYFDKPLTFYISSPKGTHNYVKFNNCTFTERITVGEAENVEFTNNRSRTYKTRFFASSIVKNLKFKNDYTLTAAGFSDRTYIDINCDTLEIEDTEFYGDAPKITVKNLIMKNACICSDENIQIDVDKIELKESEIHSLFAIKLNAKECNDFSSIKAKDITYNGLSLFQHNDSYEEIDELLDLRQKLADTLTAIKVTEETYQKEELSRYKKELSGSPLTRRLTKKDT